MDKINKLSLPATILLASIILGGFYFIAELNKQNSIEKQQQVELRAEADAEKAIRDREATERLGRMFCVDEAEELATEQYENTCSYDCKDGYYYTANYDNYYNTCLQRKGLN